MTNNLLKESKHWDLNISLEELINYNKDCRLTINYRPHKSDGCFNKFLLGFTHPASPDKKYDIEVGICEDGLVYVGNGTPNGDSKIIDTKQALKILILYGNFINAKSDFESEIISIIDQECINIIYDYNYSHEDKNKPLTFRE